MLTVLSLSAFLLLPTTAWGQAPEDPSPSEDAPPDGVPSKDAQPTTPAESEPSAGETSKEEADTPEVSEGDAKTVPPTDEGETSEEAPNEESDSDASTADETAPEAGASVDVTGTSEDAASTADESADIASASEETSSGAEAEVTLPERASLPGSARPSGLGLAPESPQAGPAAGPRAPSFGTPLDADDASLVISGNIAAWLTAGIGRPPEDAGDDYGGPIVHTPPLIAGRAPFWRQGELSLFVTYGTPMVNATINYNAFAGGREYEGYQNAVNGPQWGQAYITVSPNPLGKLRVRAIMGAFVENYAGPGQWGWGLFGPLIALRGYGESTHLEYNTSPKLKLTASGGLMGVPGIPEDFTRDRWTGWTETGVSTFAAHAHAGLNYAGKYSLRLHYAGARGTDERVYLSDDPRDGRMDVAAIEAHWLGVPWGHLGVSAGYWDLHEAKSVHDAIWWGVKYTKGAQDILGTYLGNAGRGTGKMTAISAEFNTSLARIAWHPRPFDGRSPDVRVSVAGMAHRTLETDDPEFENASGYLWATEVEYQMLRWFSFNVRAFGENRDWYGDRYGAYNLAPGLAFRSDWQSPDRIELWYSRHFYSDAVDNNPAAPLDRDVLALGIFLGF